MDYLVHYGCFRTMLPNWLAQYHITLRSQLIVSWSTTGPVSSWIKFDGRQQRYEVVLVLIHRGSFHSCYIWLDHQDHLGFYYDPSGEDDLGFYHLMSQIIGYPITPSQNQPLNTQRCALDCLAHLLSRVLGKTIQVNQISDHMIVPESLYELESRGYFRSGASARFLEYHSLRNENVVDSLLKLSDDQLLSVVQRLRTWSETWSKLNGQEFCDLLSKFSQLTLEQILS